MSLGLNTFTDLDCLTLDSIQSGWDNDLKCTSTKGAVRLKDRKKVSVSKEHRLVFWVGLYGGHVTHVWGHKTVQANAHPVWWCRNCWWPWYVVVML